MSKSSILLSVCVVLLAGIVLFNVLDGSSTGKGKNFDSPYLPEFVPVDVESAGETSRTLIVAKYEITNAQWDECVDQGGCDFKPKSYPYTRPDHPVSGVSWVDVQQYISWLSEETGLKLRLPTESEWKNFAADVLAKQEAGKKLFDDPRMEWANEYVFFSRRAPRRTRSVGHFGESAAGLADLDGNVWEWTDSCWQSNRESPAANASCRGLRVLAGTHVTFIPEMVRYVPIGGCSVGYPPANIGFRVVLDEQLERQQA